VVKVDYDDTKTDYRTLVTNFLRTIDVTDAGGQFCDRGHSYTTAIHAGNGEEATTARQAIAEAETSLGQEIVTPVEGPATFWEAEDYHQGYYMSEEKVLSRFGIVTAPAPTRATARAAAATRASVSCGAIRPLWACTRPAAETRSSGKLALTAY
jgi:peptide methionine sulfoxide reductase MsrA